MKFISKFILSFSLIILIACAKDQNATVEFTVEQLSASTNSTEFSLKVNMSGGKSILQAGILYGLDTNIRAENMRYSSTPTRYGVVSAVIEDGEKDTYTLQLTDLFTNSDYYYRPFCVVDGKVYEGELSIFETKCPEAQQEGPGGGFVIYEDGNGGGIEALPYNLAYYNTNDKYYELFFWGCQGIDVQGTVDSIGAGMMNTDTILSQCTAANQAARACDELSYGGFSDWYLPSIEELLLIYNQLYILEAGNFESLYNNSFWSSTQSSLNYVKTINFQSGSSANTNSKDQKLMLRPVRSF